MIIPVGFAQATWNFEGNGLAYPGAVTLGLDPGGGADPDDVADAINGFFASTIMTMLNDDVTLVSTQVKFGPNATGPIGEFSSNIPGSVSGTGASSQCAYLVKKNSALGGHEGRGRMYLPGVTESFIGSDGALDSTQQGLLQTEVNEFFAGLTLAGYPAVILHNSATSPTPITTAIVQAVIATQRRRLRR